jgi:hypothetical protein
VPHSSASQEIISKGKSSGARWLLCNLSFFTKICLGEQLNSELIE